MRGCALFDIQRYDDAIREFHKSVLASYCEGDSLAKIAWSYYRKSDWDNSLQYANEALSFEPENISALEARAASLITIGQALEGKKTLHRILELEPERGYSHYLLSWFYTRGHFWQEALASIDEALRLEPHDPLYFNERSRILLKLGRIDESRQASNASLSLRPDYGKSHFHRGLVLLAEGDHDESIKAFREALRQNPNDKQAKLEYFEALRHRSRWYRSYSDAVRLIERTPCKVFLWILAVGYGISMLIWWLLES
jgi:tetratricopeptide (TPR) repeat protein